MRIEFEIIVSQQVLTTRKEEQVSAEITETIQLLGKPLKRREDPRLITGRSKYVDDFKLPEMLHGAVLRSSYAHGIIKKIDISEATKAAGVQLILTSSDIPKGVSTIPVASGDDGTSIPHAILASDETVYLGEPIAFVVADTRYQAEDALELIEVEYEPLPPVIDPEKALDDSGPKARRGLKSNLVMVSNDVKGDIDAAFSKAAKVVKVDYLNQRLSPAPMEPRASLASFDLGTGFLTVWISTQGPFQIKSDIASILNLSENKVRVFAPEVGGGFGAKISAYSEELLVSIASMKLGLPVKWIESRSENFLTMTHGRGQNQSIEIAANEKGRILGVKVRLIGDSGAYLSEDSSDATFTLKMSPGPYAIPAWSGEAKIVLTNKVPHGAYRGASRPEATYLMERALDELARSLQIDPIEVRLRNFVPKEDFPYDTITELTYDSGDYSMALRKALEYSGYDKLRAEQRRLRDQGRLIGIGVSSYVEICAFGPEFPETAAITVSQTGKVTVIAGTSPHGQGHETPFAQLVADRLGVPLEDIHVIYGDTGMLPWGTFTAGSRSAALGGAAILMCANKIRDKMASIAAKELEVDPVDIEFGKGFLFSKSNRGNTKYRIEFSKVASNAYKPKKLPEGMEPVLYAFSAFAPPNYTFPFGTHIANVEIEKETGAIKILDYTSVDDCGKVFNPMIVEGQIHGGITQGIAQALLEGIEYNSDGTLLTSSFLDYQIPLGEDVPDFHSYRTETITHSNPMGVKGIGEAGTVVGTPVIANAVADALAPLGVRVTKMPLKPHYIKKLIDGSK